MVSGLLVPSFSSFDYYFKTDVVGISDQTMALLGMLGNIASLVSTQLFNAYFKNWEYRSQVQLNVFIGLLIAPFSLVFALRLNEGMGIPDLALMIFSTEVSDIF